MKLKFEMSTGSKLSWWSLLWVVMVLLLFLKCGAHLKMVLDQSLSEEVRWHHLLMFALWCFGLFMVILDVISPKNIARWYKKFRGEPKQR